MISAHRLTRRFGGRAVVDEVSFEVARSEIVALLGPNGAGKTTTMRMLAGLIAPTSGGVVINGISLTRATAPMLRARIGFLTESPGLWDRLTVRENLRTYATMYGLAQPERAIDRVIDVFQLSTQTSVRAAELSKGMRQKVALARALIHDPVVLLLDEPTSGLDPEITRGVRRLLEERRDAGGAILVSTHNLDEAERLADRVAVLHGKLLAIDRPATLRRRLATGRLIIRVSGDPARSLDTVRRFDPRAAIEGPALVLKVADIEQEVPPIVAALVAAGAAVVEVRPEMPALEDVYLQLMKDQQGAGAAGASGGAGGAGRAGGARTAGGLGRRERQ
jgi:ABC-2 type transport system ATP-binding protein